MRTAATALLVVALAGCVSMSADDNVQEDLDLLRVVFDDAMQRLADNPDDWPCHESWLRTATAASSTYEDLMAEMQGFVSGNGQTPRFDDYAEYTRTRILDEVMPFADAALQCVQRERVTLEVEERRAQ